MSCPPTSTDRPGCARALVWLRRDLRLTDHHALANAVRHAEQVYLCFVFDRLILDALPPDDRRVRFIHDSLRELDAQLAALRPGARLLCLDGDPVDLIPALADGLNVSAVFAAHDDDPYALSRDHAVRQRLASKGRAWHSVKDHVVFERHEVLTQQGQAYAVFTPYKNAWLKRLRPEDVADIGPGEADLCRALALWPDWTPDTQKAQPLISLDALGFGPANHLTDAWPGGSAAAQTRLERFIHALPDYDQKRDFPAAIDGTSRLSTDLRFGTISIRALVRAIHGELPGSGAQAWLNELIWRDFYHQILHHHPRVVSRSFKPAYDQISWHVGPTATSWFEAWCTGQTGYPLVDAAMRQLRQTGFMHNRLRMVCASFLCKDLGIDWRWGEAHFARHLLDFDLAANNGGWQWAASSGCDAQPYFRIFNPVAQSERFDPAGEFIVEFVPVLSALAAAHRHAPWLAPAACLEAAGIVLGKDYPLPIVDHAQARSSTLQRYEVVKRYPS